VCLYGPAGCGKSFLALDMALSVATGTKFLGHFDVAEGGVLYLYGEGWPGLGHRLRAWSQARSTSPSRIAFTPCRFDLTNLSAARTVIETGYRQLADRPSLVVIDTLTRYAGGRDTDRNQDMALLVGGIDLIRQAVPGGAATLTVHHTGWGDTARERGGAAFRDSLDASLAVKRVDGDAAEVTCTKQRDSDELPPYLAYRKPVELPGGGRSLVWSYFGESGAAKAAKVREEKDEKQRKATEELLRHIPRRAPSDGSTGVTVAELVAHTRSTRHQVDNLLRLLVSARRVVRQSALRSNAADLYYQPAILATPEGEANPSPLPLP
jgi:hypothetical protein